MFSSQKRKIYLQMLKAVAEAIGPDYLDQVVFVGGCTTVLFMDENDAERIRHTEDVDLIAHLFWHPIESDKYCLSCNLALLAISIGTPSEVLTWTLEL